MLYRGVKLRETQQSSQATVNTSIPEEPTPPGRKRYRPSSTICFRSGRQDEKSTERKHELKRRLKIQCMENGGRVVGPATHPSRTRDANPNIILPPSAKGLLHRGGRY